MNKILLAGTAIVALVSSSAMAADLSRPAPAPVYTKAPIMTVFTWTGCYIGGNAGGLWAKKDWSNEASSSVDISSWLAGAQIGCNYQTGPVVFGIQGDYDWANASGSTIDNALLDPNGAPLSDQTSIKSLASVTGRVGYAWDRFLTYVKGGGAWVKDDYSISSGTFSNTASETRTGWTIGVGGEYAFTDWLTGFIEYDFYDFGTNTNTFTGSMVPLQIDVKQTVEVAKAGLNFKFGGWH